MSCTNCFNNCNKGITLDTCVMYTGADNSTLSITNGSTLYSVLNSLIAAYSTTTSASSISVSLGTSCSYLNNFLSPYPYTLQYVIPAIASAICEMDSRIEDLDDVVNAPYSFDTSCLSITSIPPSKDQILQATIDKVCELAATVSTINSTYVQVGDVCDLVTQCIEAPVTRQEYLTMPKYVALPYHGPTSVFDANGNGLFASGYSNVYMCIGQTINGFTLPDYRGRVAVGQNSGIPTAGMDSVVNPALPGNAAYIIANKNKYGEFTHTSTLAETPAHTHSVTDPGHSHSMGGYFADKGDDNNYRLLTEGGSTRTLSSTTGISIASAGSGQPHNNLQPSIGAIYIMYVPQ